MSVEIAGVARWCARELAVTAFRDTVSPRDTHATAPFKANRGDGGMEAVLSMNLSHDGSC